MDYEKAYNEALERAKELLLGNEHSNTIRSYFEHIFPELRESEDDKNANALIRLLNNEKVSSLITFEAKQQWLDWLERKKTPSISFNPGLGFDPGSAVVYHNDDCEDERIRKSLIDYFKHYNPKDKWDDEFSFKDVLDYLEKQKEQKPNIEICPHSIKSKSYKENGYPIESEQKQTDLPAGFYYIDLDGNKYYSKEFRYGDMKMKVVEKEQKPAEIDFEDWDTLGYIRDIVRKHVRRDEEFNVLDKWLTEHYVIQKLAEKQDYSGLNNLERAIHRGFIVAGVENVPVTIIKETAKECLAQMEPAEWSEEDETRLTNILIMLKEYVIHHYSKDDVNKSVDWLENRFKSLRPQPQGTYKLIVHNIYEMLKDKDFFDITPSHRVSLLNDIRVRCKNADEQAEILDAPSWKPSEDEESKK